MNVYRLLFALTLAAPLGCSDPFVDDSPDGDTVRCLSGADADGDGITDEREGCSADSDNDGIPDYRDVDSDDDGVPDAIEGEEDSDGDGTPDRKQTDSDGDGVADGDEDLDGDGLLGFCLSQCGDERAGCGRTRTADGCGSGQVCTAGRCEPSAHFLCADGESSRTSSSTFEGTKDGDLPTFVCHKPDELASRGLKPMDFHRSNAGNWKVALERGVAYRELTIKDAAERAAASFDMTAADQAVAGFVVSRRVQSVGPPSDRLSALIGRLSSALAGQASVVQVSSGTSRKSHDGFPTVVLAHLSLTLERALAPPALRRKLLAPLLDGGEVGDPPVAEYGPSTTEHVVRLQLLVRNDGRELVVGGVAAKSMVDDTKLATSIHLDDLANGTALATASDTDTVECDPFIVTRNPVADIIWVVDDSTSMNDNRDDLRRNATALFQRAKQAGLDFRMGVTGVRRPGTGVQLGKLCSEGGVDDGGVDRFLLPTELSRFEACVRDPPYRETSREYGLAHAFEAINSHLPRMANRPDRIRPDAVIALIIATDETPQELKLNTEFRGLRGMLTSSDYRITNCSLEASKQAQVDTFIKPWRDLVLGDNPKWGQTAKASVHLVGGICGSHCSGGRPAPQLAHGYKELVNISGGIAADVCQEDLGATLTNIIDAITGSASSTVLEHVPISASLAVSVGQNQIERSRVKGFDYAPGTNSLVFIGLAVEKGSQVVASYRRWVKQALIE